MIILLCFDIHFTFPGCDFKVVFMLFLYKVLLYHCRSNSGCVFYYYYYYYHSTKSKQKFIYTREYIT